jgi:diacylglycerol kinase
MNPDDPEVLEYVDRKSRHIVSAEIYRRLRAMLALWQHEERMKRQFTWLALASLLVLVIVLLILRVTLWRWGMLAWLAFVVLLGAWYWRRSGKLEN